MVRRRLLGDGSCCCPVEGGCACEEVETFCVFVPPIDAPPYSVLGCRTYTLAKNPWCSWSEAQRTAYGPYPHQGSVLSPHSLTLSCFMPGFFAFGGDLNCASPTLFTGLGDLGGVTPPSPLTVYPGPCTDTVGCDRNTLFCLRFDGRPDVGDVGLFFSGSLVNGSHWASDPFTMTPGSAFLERIAVLNLATGYPAQLTILRRTTSLTGLTPDGNFHETDSALYTGTLACGDLGSGTLTLAASVGGYDWPEAVTFGCLEGSGSGASGSGPSGSGASGSGGSGPAACDCSGPYCLTGDGIDDVELVESDDCIWAGAGPPAAYWDPAAGTAQLGTFPANYADYSGTPGCGGGTFAKGTSVVPPGEPAWPDEITITPGTCGADYCATVPDFDCVPGPDPVFLTPAGGGVYAGTGSASEDVTIDTTASPVSLLLEATASALYESTDWTGAGGGTFTLTSGDPGCTWPASITVVPGGCG
jgi:hypothetical protein